MSNLYMVGYSGVKQLEEDLLSSSRWKRIDPEFARRFKALMDASILANHAVGLGGSWRSSEGQTKLFFDRYVLDTVDDDKNPATAPDQDGGDVFYNGHWYKKKPGVAAAAPPGSSYHESTTKDGCCLAIDCIGDMLWLTANCKRFGIYNFPDTEPWHIQPTGIPQARRNYKPAIHEPLAVFNLPDSPPVLPPVPYPTLREGSAGPQVALLQNVIIHFKWATGIADGQFGPKTTAMVKAMQVNLKERPDGVYGPITAAAYTNFLKSLQ